MQMKAFDIIFQNSKLHLIFISLTSSARTMQAYINSTLGRPQVAAGESCPFPSYDALNDPYLAEYFERRFNSIQMEELQRQVSLSVSIK